MVFIRSALAQHKSKKFAHSNLAGQANYQMGWGFTATELIVSQIGRPQTFWGRTLRSLQINLIQCKSSFTSGYLSGVSILFTTTSISGKYSITFSEFGKNIDHFIKLLAWIRSFAKSCKSLCLSSFWIVSHIFSTELSSPSKIWVN